MQKVYVIRFNSIMFTLFLSLIKYIYFVNFLKLLFIFEYNNIKTYL